MTVFKVNSDIALQQSMQSRIQRTQENDFEKKLKAAYDEKDDKKLKQVASDLESVFTNMMLQEMRKTVIKTDLTETTPGKDIFQTMFDEKVSEMTSKGRGIGIADMIYKQVSKEMKNKYKIEE